MKAKLLRSRADYIGITGSLLCLIHCLITPVLLLKATLVRHNSLRISYLSLDYIFIGVNIVAVYFATRQNTTQLIRICLWSFLCLFTTSILLEEVGPVFEYGAYVASLGLVMTHVANLRYAHSHHNQ